MSIAWESFTPGSALAGGLLVGFGTRLGSGCTSGHGICGLSRGSVRSVASVLMFMLTGMAVVAVAGHVLGNRHVSRVRAVLWPFVRHRPDHLLRHDRPGQSAGLSEHRRAMGSLAGLRHAGCHCRDRAHLCAPETARYHVYGRRALQWPTARKIDRRLLSGTFLFGIGWGLVGLCPGPAVVSSAQGYDDALTFVIAILVGMGAFSFWQRPGLSRRR